jgi:hypothetical protein
MVGVADDEVVQHGRGGHHFRHVDRLLAGMHAQRARVADHAVDDIVVNAAALAVVADADRPGQFALRRQRLHRGQQTRPVRRHRDAGAVEHRAVGEELDIEHDDGNAVDLAVQRGGLPGVIVEQALEERVGMGPAGEVGELAGVRDLVQAEARIEPPIVEDVGHAVAAGVEFYFCLVVVARRFLDGDGDRGIVMGEIVDKAVHYFGHRVHAGEVGGEAQRQRLRRLHWRRRCGGARAGERQCRGQRAGEHAAPGRRD